MKKIIMHLIEVLISFLKRKIKQETLVLVVGHTKASPGAQACFNLGFANEYEFNSVLAEEIKKLENKELKVEIIYRDNKTIAQTYKQLEKMKNLSSVLELHFNAFNSIASGSLCLISNMALYNSRVLKSWENKDFELLAHRLSFEFADLLKIENRFVKILRKGDRGFHNVNQIITNEALEVCPPPILIEPFFGDNPEDCQKVDVQQLAKRIFKTCLEFKRTGFH